MKPNLYILHHLKYGDCLICRGIVIEKIKTYNVSLYYLSKNKPFMDILYKGIDITLIPVENKEDAFNQINVKENKLIIGYRFLDKSTNFDRSFYNQVGLDIALKWKNFSYGRNVEDENLVYQKINKQDYAFCHMNSTRGKSKYDKILYKLPIIEPSIKLDGQTGIFSWLKVIQNAKVVIVSNSCFLNFIDLVGVVGPKLVYYKSSIPHPLSHEDPVLKSNWEII